MRTILILFLFQLPFVANCQISREELSDGFWYEEGLFEDSLVLSRKKISNSYYVTLRFYNDSFDIEVEMPCKGPELFWSNSFQILNDTIAFTLPNLEDDKNVVTVTYIYLGKQNDQLRFIKIDSL